jgi:hypothetical protein
MAKLDLVHHQEVFQYQEVQPTSSLALISFSLLYHSGNLSSTIS